MRRRIADTKRTAISSVSAESGRGLGPRLRLEETAKFQGKARQRMRAAEKELDVPTEFSSDKAGPFWDETWKKESLLLGY